MLLAALEAGDSMGEINLFDPGTASASAVVRSAGIVWVLSRENLDACMDADPVAGTRILRALLGQLARRIRAMNEKLATAEKKSSLHEFWGARSSAF